ncbi:MAG: HD domain-containing protein [Candidatus Pacebacteria bacterium]|nr:HD domain-containing protein [Candidatus Paceibacterota bacterium]
MKIKDIVCAVPFSSDHDFEHTMRVYNLCLHLAKYEKNVNLDVLEAAALLHDIARGEENSNPLLDHALLGAEMAGLILKEFDFIFDEVENIKHCISAHRYRNNINPKTIEAKILFDADKLDSLGAIGIARAIAWVGRNNTQIYTNPQQTKQAIKNKDKNTDSPQIEFEVKIKMISKRMFTASGKKIAKERMAYYKQFLNRLEKEINGCL